MINRCIINLLLVLALASCASEPVEPEKVSHLNLIGEPESITAEEAIALVKATSPQTQASDPSNHPTKNPSQSVFKIYKGESLFRAVSRLSESAGYSRVIYDLSESSVAPALVIAKSSAIVDNHENIFEEIFSHFGKEGKGLKFYAAGDGMRKALIISNKPYHRWQSLEVFDVKSGTLKENATRLAGRFNWSLHPNADWKAKNYRIETGYPIVIVGDDPQLAYLALFDKYPAQARLNHNTRGIIVVERLAPVEGA